MLCVDISQQRQHSIYKAHIYIYSKIHNSDPSTYLASYDIVYMCPYTAFLLVYVDLYRLTLGTMYRL